jgi:hypothetical protein
MRGSHRELRARATGDDAEDEVLLARQTSIERSEYVDIIARRVRFSRLFAGFYISVIVASLIEVVWVLTPHGGVGRLPDSALFVFVETYVTVGLVLELLLRAILQRAHFCSDRGNILDTVVVAISVTTSLIVASGNETETEILLTELVIAGRVAFRLLRLLTLTKSFHRQQAATALDVSLDSPDASARSGSPESGRSWEQPASPNERTLSQLDDIEAQRRGTDVPVT